ncbi:MAG: hypothetical protein HC835_10940 [Oscillatoriales cyanobacterium RM2_1_1]|nr:hypothetical protein [Oscillatoriales cyanobacterium SM2_3_0]NJO46094.1 hypothetical protein [Oscillatoriales cyanobacterium RM2_1_1]
MVQAIHKPSASLPQSWQQVLANGHTKDAERYAALAQDFLRQTVTYDPSFVVETVDAYGKSFLKTAYPDFEVMFWRAEQHPQTEWAEKLVLATQALFSEFQYEVSSFLYWAILHPLEREDIFLPASLRQGDQKVARELDSANHGLNVSMMRRAVDAITSQYGLFVEHGCACDKHAYRLAETDARVQFTLAPNFRHRTLRAFLWNSMEEYALFPLRVTTDLVYAD